MPDYRPLHHTHTHVQASSLPNMPPSRSFADVKRIGVLSENLMASFCHQTESHRPADANSGIGGLSILLEAFSRTIKEPSIGFNSTASKVDGCNDSAKNKVSHQKTAAQATSHKRPLEQVDSNHSQVFKLPRLQHAVQRARHQQSSLAAHLTISQNTMVRALPFLDAHSNTSRSQSMNMISPAPTYRVSPPPPPCTASQPSPPLTPPLRPQQSGVSVPPIQCPQMEGENNPLPHSIRCNSAPSALPKVMRTTGKNPTNSTALRSGRWTEQEHDAFLSALSEHGKDWAMIAQIVKTRTRPQCRSHAQKYFRSLKTATNVQQSGLARIFGKACSVPISLPQSRLLKKELK